MSMSSARDIHWKSNKVLAALSLVLLFSLMPTEIAHAQGKGYGVQVRSLEPLLLEVNPGEIVSVSFVVENKTGREETFEESFVLPEGWMSIVPLDVFTLRPGEETVRVLAFQVPLSAEAKEYLLTYSVRSRRDYAMKDEAILRVMVLQTSKLAFFLEAAPEAVTAGEAYEIEARLTNGGNVSLDVEITASSSRDYPLTLSERELTLKPGQAAPIIVSAKTPEDLAKSFRHIVTLKAKAKGPHVAETSLSAGTEVLAKAAEIDLYHRIPATLTLRAMGERNERDSDGFDVKLEGEGWLEEEKRRRVEFLFRGPDTQEKGLFGERDEYYMNYFDPEVDLRVGDQSYGLSYLTSYSRYGRGLEAKYHPGDEALGLGGYYLKNRFTAPDWEERGLYAAKALSPKAKLKLNYLNKESKSYNAYTDVKDDIYSIEGEFEPTKETRLYLEYAEGERNEGSDSFEDSAYRVEAYGAMGEARYAFNKIHAEPDFYGYYNDSDYMYGSVNFPLSSRLRGFLSYSGYETNLDLRRDKGYAATKETLLQSGINYSFDGGWYAELAFDDFHRKDSFYPPSYDVEEEAYRFSVGRSAGKFNYRAEVRYADQYDRVKGSFASPWNYSFHISYMPKDELYFTLYGGFGDDSAIEGSRLLSDQDNLGFSFRWQATWRLTLSGWYTKYNFDSKRPESDNYRFEVRYAMPDESYWTFEARRYDWEYGEYAETDYMISYSIPIGIPVGKKSSLGLLQGRIFRAEADGKAPISGAIVTLNGSKATSDASGRFSFSAPPGEYILNIDRASVGFGKTATVKLPAKLLVEAGKTTKVELTIVEAANVSGRVVLASEEAVRATKEEAVVVGELGVTEAPKAFKGILIELAREDEIIRTMTDDEGKFAFKDIRPGSWKFKAYDYNIPAYHYIQNPEMTITLSPGEKKDITVNVVPKKRRIEILEEGVIK